ncbi:transposase InsO family protein [Nonomuraea angiospora]|uniref:Transposase InsO family protein n=1 Tax=Nonomuraea angiospora TaxID=46172 RepID=A0ABR9M5P6_9ACTN|nr:transposase InsO family protein [Nonomuraea angiospora]
MARLMRAAGLAGVSRRKGCRTIIGDPRATAASDLVRRRLCAEEPNRIWTADITYVPTWEGFVYLAVVLDVFSRRIVGWAMADHMRTELVTDALAMAIHQRRPRQVSGVIHHSDKGSSTPRSPSASDVNRPAPARRRAAPGHALTTPSPKASLLRWSVN